MRYRCYIKKNMIFKMYTQPVLAPFQVKGQVPMQAQPAVPIPRVTFPFSVKTIPAPTVHAPLPTQEIIQIQRGAIPIPIISPTIPNPVASPIPRTTLNIQTPTIRAPVTPKILIPTYTVPISPAVPTTFISPVVQTKIPTTFAPPVVQPKIPIPFTLPVVQPKIPFTPQVVQPKTPTIALPITSPKTPTIALPITSPKHPTIPFPATSPKPPTVPFPTISPKNPTESFPAISPKNPTVPFPVTSPKTQIVALPITLLKTPTTVIPKQVITPTTGLIPLTPEVINEETIIEFANGLDQPNFSNLLRFLADYYHNDAGLVSDEIFDELTDIYETKYGPYEVVGAEPTGEKVDLPYYLGSLRKIKKENELTGWLEKYPGPYIIEDKIDGLTLLLVSGTIQGKRVTTLYTRGGGYRGVDVSHLLDYIRLPQINEDIAIRGEIVMTKESFSRVGAGFKNARNLTSGILNSKKQFDTTLARELSFYPYRILNKNMTPEEDINELRKIGFLVPTPVSAPNLTTEILENYLKQRKIDAPYEIDGLVIYQNVVGEYPKGENPRHVVAFKIATESTTTTVTNVIWEASKDRLLKPVIHYDPITLSGAVLQKASGYNARFIVTNNIGPGAKILVTRSGDVIPKVISVLTPAPNGPAIPDPAVHGKYAWNENQVEFVLLEDNDQVIINKLKHFLETLNVKGIGPQRIRIMVQAGIRNIYDLLTVSAQQLATIPGIGLTLSNQMYDDIHERIMNVPLARIMDASGIFPRIGEKRFEAIFEVYPNLLDWAHKDPNIVANYIRGVRGFNTLAVEIANRLRSFADWLQQHPMITIQKPVQHLTLGPLPTTFTIGNKTVNVPTLGLRINTVPQQIYTTPPQTYTIPPQTYTTPPQTYTAPQQTYTTPQQTLTGTTVVFSGFRDKELEQRIKSAGGKVTTAVSRNTSFLILKDINDRKGKAMEAEKKGVPLISREDFIQRYL